MRVNGGDNFESSIKSSASQASDSAARTAAVSDKVEALLSTKNISQMNEFDIGNMPVSEKIVIEAIQKANKAISGGNRRFEFSIHEKTNEIVVKVFDSQTNELIREIPNEKVLDMVAKMCEMAGILVDERR
ncbi:flagellar protein FlaG [Ruminiclostridium hungatei]|uniref:Flagellar protein FlaG n=1 Tax=Ruminiclostridium hungatei TaxID=48256 RepID=A0A1V4SQD3_RUMHU|nr:flagellar protein FlaG [Ruminiclostridium hungatei]OPX45665.1 flagellar protein FlaG [Ruminiclostridium hungatei]